MFIGINKLLDPFSVNSKMRYLRPRDFLSLSLRAMISSRI